MSTHVEFNWIYLIHTYEKCLFPEVNCDETGISRVILQIPEAPLEVSNNTQTTSFLQNY